ncbi:MAG: tRNA uridine-5-carboxymethylaminomethyl(34) synthesis GTPase MnmE [Planctomycetes bacterium]|nr:tRNA uridine-5-carboxymethylaminomethyl(34) synthesis GTPase MnmE [Planctomycetota bacterium]
MIRVSGPRTLELVRAVWVGDVAPSEGLPRAVLSGEFDDGRGRQPLLLLWMPGPRSFTREDVAEFHLPGSPPLVRCALERLLAEGARLAGPGEFTRRAFESGRIDLTRAEGVLALVEARGAEERRAALALVTGGLAGRVGDLRAALEDLRVTCEANLDFEETETGHVPRCELESTARAVAEGLAEALAWEERRTPPTGEARVVLAGAPNAGKSALFNALVEGGAALVSELAPTTRDVAEGPWILGDVRVALVDCAGVGNDDARAGSVEALAHEGARGARAAADLLLWVVDATRSDAAALAREAARLPADVPRVLAWSKTDLAAAVQRPPAELLAVGRPAAWAAVCALAGGGLEELTTACAESLGFASAGLPRELSARHREGLRAAASALGEGLDGWRSGAPLDLFAAHLREACDALDAIDGRTTPEDVLERLFARFCIGK